jgi:hypothetical protein
MREQAGANSHNKVLESLNVSAEPGHEVPGSLAAVER